MVIMVSLLFSFLRFFIMMGFYHSAGLISINTVLLGTGSIDTDRLTLFDLHCLLH